MNWHDGALAEIGWCFNSFSLCLQLSPATDRNSLLRAIWKQYEGNASSTIQHHPASSSTLWGFPRQNMAKPWNHLKALDSEQTFCQVYRFTCSSCVFFFSVFRLQRKIKEDTSAEPWRKLKKGIERVLSHFLHYVTMAQVVKCLPCRNPRAWIIDRLHAFEYEIISSWSTAKDTSERTEVWVVLHSFTSLRAEERPLPVRPQKKRVTQSWVIACSEQHSHRCCPGLHLLMAMEGCMFCLEPISNLSLKLPRSSKTFQGKPAILSFATSLALARGVYSCN